MLIVWVYASVFPKTSKNGLALKLVNVFTFMSLQPVPELKICMI